ncbi:hypothetical protein ACEN2I_17765 [Flavobacterium sp. W22_SRS_FK3]|uniref:hypothetical protein n=1 Tax=Flavobacterium sp. W22_SRS_FK3 TaxID=3240275 RepID=UPI003F8EF17E
MNNKLIKKQIRKMKAMDITNKRRLRRRFPAPGRASGFEMQKVFQAAQNTTCWFPPKPFLEIDLMKGLDALFFPAVS